MMVKFFFLKKKKMHKNLQERFCPAILSTQFSTSQSFLPAENSRQV